MLDSQVHFDLERPGSDFLVLGVSHEIGEAEDICVSGHLGLEADLCVVDSIAASGEGLEVDEEDFLIDLRDHGCHGDCSNVPYRGKFSLLFGEGEDLGLLHVLGSTATVDPGSELPGQLGGE